MAGHRVVLAVQDSTSLNDMTHPGTAGLGALGSHRRNRGLLLHSTLALSPQGQSLGLLDAQLSARAVVRGKRARKRVINRQPVEEKESVKWLRGFEAARGCLEGGSGGPQIVNVCDREGDLYELLLLGQQHRGRVDVLVRAVCKRRVRGEERFLWEVAGAEAPLGLQKVQLPRRPGQGAREVSLEIRCREVELPAPRDKAHYFGQREVLRVWAIEAGQVLPQGAKESICWRLLTTIPTAGLAEACEKVAKVYAALADRNLSQDPEKRLPDRSAPTGECGPLGARPRPRPHGGLAHFGLEPGRPGEFGATV